MMNRKFVGIAAITVAFFVSQISVSEACHRHRRVRHARNAVVVQPTYYSHEYVAVNAYPKSADCGCASSVYGSNSDRAYHAGYAPVDHSQTNAVPAIQADDESRTAPGYMPSNSSGVNARVNGTVQGNQNMPTADSNPNALLGQ